MGTLAVFDKPEKIELSFYTRVLPRRAKKPTTVDNPTISKFTGPRTRKYPSCYPVIIYNWKEVTESGLHITI